MSGFRKGFEKTAVSPEAISLGMRLGAVAGGLYALMKAKNFSEETLINKEKHQDAKQIFNQIKPALPKNTILLTNKDLQGRVSAAKSIDDLHFWQSLRDATEGNAAALPASATKGMLFELSQKIPLLPKVPKEIVQKNLILSPDTVHPDIFAHEAGHIIDFDEEDRGGFKARLKNTLSLPFRAERAAWDHAAKTKIKTEELDKIRSKALGTYYGGALYPILGTLLGGGLSYGIGKMLAKTP